MTRAERVLAALDENFVLLVKDAENAAWGRTSGGEPVDSSVAKCLASLDKLSELHEKLRAAVANKFAA
jgi:hypothetical protein